MRGIINAFSHLNIYVNAAVFLPHGISALSQAGLIDYAGLKPPFSLFRRNTILGETQPPPASSVHHQPSDLAPAPSAGFPLLWHNCEDWRKPLLG